MCGAGYWSADSPPTIWWLLMQVGLFLLVSLGGLNGQELNEGGIHTFLDHEYLQGSFH